jgi:phage-related protein
MTPESRPISWVKPALKDLKALPGGAKLRCLSALTTAVEGKKADIVEPLHGFGLGLFEVALPRTPKDELTSSPND